jgi:hypothetical protein
MSQQKQKKPVKKNELAIVETVEGEIVEREAPKERRIDIKDVLLPTMNLSQLRIVTGKTPDWAIKVRQGGGGTSLRYVPHGYVTDTLNKAFGYDWDLVLEPMAEGKMYELQMEPVLDAKTGADTGKPPKRHVAVTGKLVVRIRDQKGNLKSTIVKSGFGSQIWLPTMEFGDALKAARSDLLKTCAFQLGIALDLYWNEQAELQTYANKKAAQAEHTRIAAQFSSEPDTAILLITRAMSDYKYDTDKICEIGGIKSFDEILLMDATQVSELWKKVKDAGEKEK